MDRPYAGCSAVALPLARRARLVPGLLLPRPLARPAVRATLRVILAALGVLEACARLETGHDMKHGAPVREALDRVHDAAIGGADERDRDARGARAASAADAVHVVFRAARQIEVD